MSRMLFVQYVFTFRLKQRNTSATKTTDGLNSTLSNVERKGTFFLASPSSQVTPQITEVAAQ